MTTDLPIILNGPNNGRLESLNTPLKLVSLSKDPYFPLKSPTSYWSGVPSPGGGLDPASTPRGFQCPYNVLSSQGNSK